MINMKNIFFMFTGITDYSSLKYINLDLVVGGSNAEKIMKKMFLIIKTN